MGHDSFKRQSSAHIPMKAPHIIPLIYMLLRLLPNNTIIYTYMLHSSNVACCKITQFDCDRAHNVFENIGFIDSLLDFEMVLWVFQTKWLLHWRREDYLWTAIKPFMCSHTWREDFKILCYWMAYVIKSLSGREYANLTECVGLNFTMWLLKVIIRICYTSIINH